MDNLMRYYVVQFMACTVLLYGFESSVVLNWFSIITVHQILHLIQIWQRNKRPSNPLKTA
jgi:hypothetical protein